MPPSRLNHLDINPDQLTSEAVPTGIGANLKGGFNYGMVSGMAGDDSKAHTERQVWRPIIEELNKIPGNKFTNPADQLLGFFDEPFIYMRLKGRIYNYIRNNIEILPEDLKNLNESHLWFLNLTFIY